MEKRFLARLIRWGFLEWTCAWYAVLFHLTLGKRAVDTMILWAANILPYIRINVEHLYASVNVGWPLSGSRIYPSQQEVVIFDFIFDVSAKSPKATHHNTSHNNEKKGRIMAGERSKDMKGDSYKSTGKETN
jgi:hypothetical protein